MQRHTQLFSPTRAFFSLITGLAVGAIMFKVIAPDLKGVVKDFPTDRAIAFTGLLWCSIDSIWALRRQKKEEKDYRQALQESLEMLRQQSNKK